jgi:hypothetical protein
MAADDLGHQAIMPQVIEAAILAVTLTRRINQGQIAWAAEAMDISLLALEKALFKRNRDVLGKTDADKTTGGDGIAIFVSVILFR